jgi:malate synthase
VNEGQLLEVPKGNITEEGLRTNIRVAIQYIEAWLGGLGCVPLYNLMEDAATAEISRTQVWQWIHNARGTLVDGRKVTLPLVRQLIGEELDRIRAERGSARFEAGHFQVARRLFDDLASSPELDDFLTLKAYELLDKVSGSGSITHTLPRRPRRSPTPRKNSDPSGLTARHARH